MNSRIDNWKKKELFKIEVLKNELILKNTDPKIIDNFINEQYDIIINKYNEKKKINEEKQNKNKNKKKNKCALKNLINNILILENNIDKNKLNEYINKEYDIIVNQVDLHNVNFIDN